MAEAASYIPITEADLLPHAKRAESDITEVEWRPKKVVTPGTGPVPLMLGAGLSSAEPPAEKMSLWKTAREFCGGELIISSATHQVLSTVKRGLEIGAHIESLYVKATGLDVLEAQNTAKTLPESQKAEFNAKQTTRTAAMLFSAATYIVWELGGYRTEEVSSVSMEAPTICECPLGNVVLARRCALFYLGQGLSDETVNTDLAFVKFTILYFRALIAEIKLREEQILYDDAFTDRQYRLEGTEFTIDGFNGSKDRAVSSVLFNKISFDEIVGNQQAKHMALRYCSRMLCYDLEQKKNPMRELGGLPPVIMGEGVPGTGKSMMIAAISTLLAEKCEWLGIPYLFHPLPDNIISSFQGTSAERMDSWMRALKDPSRVVYAPIDDAENTLEERTRQGVSEGVRGVIGVFLRNTEGAYAVNNGNTLLHVCTNIPEQLDKAVLSRIVARFVIDGAQTEHDMLDQDYLWWKKYEEIMPKFIGMENPGDYAYLHDQRKITALTDLGERYFDAKEPRVQEILARVKARYKPKQHRFFAALFDAVQEVFPFFTSRDIRNIQMAVTGRILDFDFPALWFEKQEHFFRKPYDDKKIMLLDLMKENMKGLSFAEIRLEESLRYIDGMVRITDKDRERKIEALVQELEMRIEAERRFKDRQKKK